MASSNRPRAYLDVAVGSAPPARLVVELRPDVAPRTCANFLALCSGERRRNASSSSRDPLWFQGTTFHRIIPGFMMQGGDTTAGDGTGGASIYGPTFDDEAFALRHDAAGVLSSANAGPNTNSSQFFVLFAGAPWLDGKHVVFGRVVEGMEGAVRAAERVGTKGGTPRQKVVVVGCGVVGGDGTAAAAAAAAALPAKRAGEAAAADVVLDGDDASRERLRRLRGGGGGEGRSGVVSAPVPGVRTAQDELREAAEAEAKKKREEEEEEEEEASAARAAAAATEVEENEEEEEAGARRERVERGGEAAGATGGDEGGGGGSAAPPPPPPPPPGSANSRAAKLELLRSKLAASRKANAGAVIAEKRREAAAAARSRRADDGGREGEEQGGGSNNGAAGAAGFRAWSREAAAERAAECARLGLPLSKAHLLDRADAAEARIEKKKRRTFYKAETDDSAQETVAAAAAYERRMANLPTAVLAAAPGSSAAAAASAAAAGGSSSLAYGGASRDSKEAVERMARELAAEGARARAQKIQRAAAGGGGGGGAGDVDAISTRNEDFNRKLGAKYGAAAAEIRANLERGTALPDNS